MNLLDGADQVIAMQTKMGDEVNDERSVYLRPTWAEMENVLTLHAGNSTRHEMKTKLCR